MEPTALISTLNDRLATRLGLPVRTNTENERPVPAVILDDMSVTDYTFHNTALAGVKETGAATSDERYFRFYYDVRLDYVVRHHSDPDASLLFDDLREEFMRLRIDPSLLDADINAVTLRGGGGIDTVFVESSEAEMTQSVEFTTFHQVLRDNYDTIQDIQMSFTLD